MQRFWGDLLANEEVTWSRSTNTVVCINSLMWVRRMTEPAREDVSFAVWVLNERLYCKCSSKVSIYTRGRGQEDDDDDPQSPL